MYIEGKTSYLLTKKTKKGVSNMTTKNVKVIKRVKKVNEKDLAKAEIMEIIQNALTEKGLDWKCGVAYGMTNGTIIVEHEKTDIQIKPINPKAGMTRYPEIVYE